MDAILKASRRPAEPHRWEIEGAIGMKGVTGEGRAGEGRIVFRWTRLEEAVGVPADTRRSVFSDVQAAHDLEQAGVIGEPQLFRGTGDVPIIPLQGCDDDLPLGLEP